jgi:ferredoxin
MEDTQGRLHRIHARAVVKIRSEDFLPEPFLGWASEGVLPVTGAEKLLALDRALSWMPAVAILGTGNRALRLGSMLLKKRQGSERPDVWIIESKAHWEQKRYAGWEVEHRRFLMAGGKILFGKPLSLEPKTNVGFEFKVQDANGTRILDISKLICAGPFENESEGIREYPAESLLFEMAQTAVSSREFYPEGWFLEEERARLLSTQIVRALVPNLGAGKDFFESNLKKAKSRLKLSRLHYDRPFEWKWEGKWLQSSQREDVRTWGGLPKGKEEKAAVASVECFEEIGCRICEKACPEKAIEFTKAGRRGGPVLNEQLCTGCGVCVKACPSEAIVLLGPMKSSAMMTIQVSWTEKEPWRVNEKAVLVSRSGEPLGQGRISQVWEDGRVEVQVPQHLQWEVRSVRRLPEQGVSADDPDFRRALEREQGDVRIEILLNGERRYVKPESNLIEAFRQIGHLRPRDMLACGDGSCGRCTVQVDGIKRLACETPVRRGMSVKSEKKPAEPADKSLVICPCEGITVSEVNEVIRNSHLCSPEGVIEATRVGRGRCHGQMCNEPLRRQLVQNGLESARQWIDWRFPWRDWKIGSAERDET